MLGLGGEVAFTHASEEQAESVFDAAMRNGIRYIDTAHAYEKSQERIGKFLKNYPDVDVFIATKSGERSRDGFLRELDENIEKLGRIPDIMHIHNVERGDEYPILKTGGTLDAALEAKEKGLCRYIGITGHANPDILSKVVRGSEGAFDATLCATSVADTRFMTEYIPLCRSYGMAVIGMKVMGRGKLIRPNGVGVRTASEAIRFVLSGNVDVAIVGFSFPEEVDELASVVRDFHPMGMNEMRDLVGSTSSYADEVQFYKEGAEWKDVKDIRESLDDYVGE
jgi:predicted aldo/keto reductase-like oxidoreductase